LVAFDPSSLPLLPHTHIVDEKKWGEKKTQKKKPTLLLAAFAPS